MGPEISRQTLHSLKAYGKYCIQCVYAYGLNCVPPDSYEEALTANVALFEYRALKEMTKII